MKKTRINPLELPYRRGVGMMIINDSGHVFVGKRIDTKVQAWQMPQGGIDLGETPSKAALREMREEIGSDKAVIVAETKNWYSYNLPTHLIPNLWDGKYQGQKQKWFLVKFIGKDEEININSSKNPEFDSWMWVSVSKLPSIIVPFKKKLYEAIIKEFQVFLKGS